MTAFGTFFLPGPTEVRPEVLAAMTRAMIGHRGADFEAVYREVADGLRRVFRTSQPVLIATASATGLMEAGVRGLPEGRVLAIVNGAFSERFARIAEACGRPVTVLRVPDGEVATADDLRDALRRDRFAGVTVVHSETSTGALTDLESLGAVARAHGVPLVVDSVTGLAGAPLECDAWGLPFVLTGSQKALALPPGLAFAVAQPAFLAAAAQVPGRGLYLDVVEMAAFAAKGQTPNTPAISLFFAAQVQLRHLLAEGIEARWARHAAMADRTAAWAAGAETRTGVALQVVAPPGNRSPTVTALRVPKGTDPAAVVAGAKARGFVIGGGYGALKGETFRIGHMGDHTLDGLEGCLEAVDDALRDVGRRRPG